MRVDPLVKDRDHFKRRETYALSLSFLSSTIFIVRVEARPGSGVAVGLPRALPPSFPFG